VRKARERNLAPHGSSWRHLGGPSTPKDILRFQCPRAGIRGFWCVKISPGFAHLALNTVKASAIPSWVRVRRRGAILTESPHACTGPNPPTPTISTLSSRPVSGLRRISSGPNASRQSFERDRFGIQFRSTNHRLPQTRPLVRREDSGRRPRPRGSVSFDFMSRSVLRRFWRILCLLVRR
jgi:hypothetical protein